MILLAVALAIGLIGSVNCLCSDNNDCKTCVETMGCRWCPSSGCQSFLLSICLANNAIYDNYNCPQPINITYDDSFVRNRVFPLQGATKAVPGSNTFKACLAKSDLNATHVGRVNVTCGLIFEYCTTDVYILNTQKAVVAVSHGSTGSAQILHFGAGLYTFAPITTMKGFNGTVLDYVASGYNSLWTGGLEAMLRGALNANPDYELWSIGHSLGGSLANVIAAQLSFDGTRTADTIKMISFGQPRTGDLQYCKHAQLLLPYNIRLVNKKDTIPSLPKRIVNFGVIFPQHMRYEVRYPSGMLPSHPYYIWDSPEDPTWNNIVLDSDHTTYFGVNIDTWWQNGCAY